ncbi:hypothetical protein BDD12DRAFT_876263 [Trichophaea hybrida]|nr:hypothetical protein BDD12DRAFT_879586 [Trichophaea hybrida]KAF8542468.1 hypothetical protein BDD12DRAFT_876263 [Trichophaea hybrida]
MAPVGALCPVSLARFGIWGLGFPGYLWMPLDQYTHRSLTTAAYNHVMSLSYDFHMGKKTGEIWSSIAQGRSVNGFIETVFFQIVPMLVDLCVAFAYFFHSFDAYMALIVAVVSVVYLWVTAKLSAIRNDMRRDFESCQFVTASFALYELTSHRTQETKLASSSKRYPAGRLSAISTEYHMSRAVILGIEKITGTIDFENVSFSYDPRKSAITDLSFHVPPATFRFFDVQSGSIKIDGHDIRDIKLASLRDNIGVVPQDPQLFNDTIMSNIKYANFDAKDEDVYEACRAASIHDKILSFPDGYLSKVGERGVRLSGGELQRVSIARAILKNPQIILLDEATSMIDMETERQIQDAFNKLAKDRTMFIVAHRLSTIMNADQIIVIKEGRIVEKGSHDQLLDAKGKYYQLWSKQSKPDESPLKPTSKRPLLIDDLYDASTRDGPSPEQIQNFRTTSTPTVAFSLPERTEWGPEYRPQPSVNPRMAAPNHGILKNATRLQGLDGNKGGPNPSSKPASLLKPDAKEFVPRRYSSIALPRPSTLNDMSPEGILVEQRELEPSKAKELVEKTLFDDRNPEKTAPPQKEDQTVDVTCPDNTNIEATECICEDVGNAEPETDNPQGTRKRRRRVRRRSNKLRSGESEESTDAKQNSSGEGTENEVLVAEIADSPTVIKGEGPQAIEGGRVGSANGKYTEEATSAPLSALPSAGNCTTVFKVKPRTELSNQSGSKLPFKEDQSPRENAQRSDSLTSSSKRENMQRRNSGGDKCQEQRNGTWRKGYRKPKSSESGSSISES